MNFISEWHFPDNFESIPDVITLYHGTDYYSLMNILENGIIDARNGRSTGETKNMNWFFTEYKTNYSRGFVFSIEIHKSEINKTTDGFKYMNNNEIANYEPIDIKNRNFKIVEAFNYDEDMLKNIWKNSMKKNPDDELETIYSFAEFFNKYTDYDITIDDLIIQQLISQFIGKNKLYQYGIVENKINEVSSNDISLKSFDVQEKLHPRFWINDKLNSRVRLRLLDIADDFIDTLAVDWVKPKDIVFTGSLANYNWSRFSDIDVHVIIDYDKVYKKKEFVEDYFNSKKELWLNEHPKLKIYGFPIEFYVEDVDSDNSSNGIYSLNKNKWLKKPVDFQDAKLNEKYIKKHAAKLMTDIDNIEKKIKSATNDTQIEHYNETLKDIFDKIKKMRVESLKKSGEMSSGNIIFKILRRSKYIDKIWDIINTSYDKINSIKIIK